VEHASTSAPSRGRAVALLALAALASLVLAVGSHAIIADDHWVLIATGREALRTLSIPSVDHFSFTYAGHSYVDWEWLSAVVLALAYDSLGASGLITLRLLVLAGTVLAVARRMRPHVDPLRDPAALGVLFGIVVTLHLRVGDRPHNLGLLLLAIVLLTGRRLAQTPTWPGMAGHGALLVIWAQVHPSFSLGIVALLVQILDAMRIPGSPWRNARRWAVAAGLVLLACASVPAGFRYYQVLFGMAGVEVSSEWSPVLDHLGHDHPWFYAFHALVFGLGLSIVLDRDVRRSAETWLAVLLVVMAYRHARMTGDAVVVAAGPIVRAIASRRAAGGGYESASVRRLALVMLLDLVLVGWVWVETVRLYPAPLFSLDRDRNPVSQAAFLREHGLGGRVYAPTRGTNGYLTMMLYPALKTSFDGRTPQLFPVEHCAALEKQMDGETFRSTARSLRFDWVVIPGPLFDAQTRRWGFVVEASGDYELVSFDAHGMLFGRRAGSRGKCGSACAPYSALAPWRMGSDWARQVLDRTSADSLAEELERLARVPDAQQIAAAAAAALAAEPGLNARLKPRLLALAKRTP
jgi:hypothetical protein